MEKAILVFVRMSDRDFRGIVEEVLVEEGGLQFDTISSSSESVICYLASPVGEYAAQAIEFLRVARNTVTFFVPVGLLERVEEKREDEYDLLPTDIVRSIDPRAITILARVGGEESVVVGLVRIILDEIERDSECRFARLANMAILHEIRNV